MEMSAPIRFGTEGFRGVIAREFTFATLHRLAEAYGRHLLERGGGLVVVGHDTRFLADAFARALSGHLAGMGLKVVLLKGPVPTPLLSFAVRHLKAAGGAMLTASHNPPQYLGVKFKDAELIGIPTIVVVGRGITDEKNPTIEVKDRKSGDREDIAAADIVRHLVDICRR